MMIFLKLLVLHFPRTWICYSANSERIPHKYSLVQCSPGVKLEKQNAKQRKETICYNIKRDGYLKYTLYNTATTIT